MFSERNFQSHKFHRQHIPDMSKTHELTIKTSRDVQSKEEDGSGERLEDTANEEKKKAFVDEAVALIKLMKSENSIQSSPTPPDMPIKTEERHKSYMP